MDIDLRGNFELWVNGFERLQAKLDESLMKKHHERPVHPCNLLTSANSPYRMKEWSYLFVAERFVKGILRGRLVLHGPLDSLHLAVYGGVFVKKEPR